MNNRFESHLVSNDQDQDQPLVRRYAVVGSRRLSNYFWAAVSGFGGLDFLLTGLSSFKRQNLLWFIHAENIAFFPQGLVMCFYAVLGLLTSLFIGLTIVWGVGEGFNILDKSKNQIRIFRWGYPGKNRRVDLCYDLKEIKFIGLELKQGWNGRRTIYVCLKNDQKVPLTRVGQPMTLEAIETLATDIGSFLKIDVIYLAA